MRLEWLEDLLAVAETGSFREAAERRHLTPSAFSRRIRGIEDHVGVALFDRTRKPVQLQRTTIEQHDQILKTVRTLRQLVEDLRRGGRQSENRIVLASQHSLTTSLTPDLVRRIHARQGDVHVRLRSANLDACFGLLLARKADIAIVYRLEGGDHPVRGDYIETIGIGTDRLIPVCAHAAELWLRARHDAGEVPVIAYPDDVFLGDVVNRRILPNLGAGVTAVPRAETALTLAALELACVGVGVAWVPESLARARIAAGVLADMSASLPGCALTVTATRLRGHARDVEAMVWDLLNGGDSASRHTAAPRRSG